MPSMIWSVPERCCTSVSRTGPPGRSRKPTQPRNCAAGRRSSPFSRGTTCWSGPESDLVPMADAFGLAVVAWGPLAEGRLTGKYRAGGQGRLRDDATEGIFQHSWSGPDWQPPTCTSTMTNSASSTRPPHPRWASRMTCYDAKRHHRHVRRPMAPGRRPEHETPPQHLPLSHDSLRPGKACGRPPDLSPGR